MFGKCPHQTVARVLALEPCQKMFFLPLAILQGERKNGSPNELIRFFGQRLLYGQDGHIKGDV
jgi:hypothetical protein